MIHVISAVNRHLYEDVLEQHFRIRHEIFVEERKWEALRKPDGREIDTYEAVLGYLKKQIKAGDGEALERVFKRASETRLKWGAARATALHNVEP